MQDRLPDVVIAGAQKAGTTWLLRNLVQHQRVHRRHGEVHYWDRWVFTEDLDWYRAQWENVGPHQLLVDKSPLYLACPWVPGRMAAAMPAARVIVMLRNPIDRAHSALQMYRRRGLAPHDADHTLADALALETARPWFPRFLDPAAEEEFVEHWGARREPLTWDGAPHYVARGIYLPQLQRWHRHYPPEQVLVLFAEEARRDPVGHLHRVCAFLGIPPMEIPQRELAPSRYEDLGPGEREALTGFFDQHNEALGAYLGVASPWE